MYKRVIIYTMEAREDINNIPKIEELEYYEVNEWSSAYILVILTISSTSGDDDSVQDLLIDRESILHKQFQW